MRQHRQSAHVAWMNAEAFAATIRTGQAHYWSRSRQKLWHKGETSGHVQQVQSMSLDCDGDAILLQVLQTESPAIPVACPVFFKPW
jgi:phosphoribosyl-AMP cyclohydrolase